MRQYDLEELHERIAADLGWSWKDVQSFSLMTLRELVKSQKLKDEISRLVNSGEHIYVKE